MEWERKRMSFGGAEGASWLARQAESLEGVSKGLGAWDPAEASRMQQRLGSLKSKLQEGRMLCESRYNAKWRKDGDALYEHDPPIQIYRNVVQTIERELDRLRQLRHYTDPGDRLEHGIISEKITYLKKELEKEKGKKVDESREYIKNIYEKMDKEKKAGLAAAGDYYGNLRSGPLGPPTERMEEL